MPDILLFALNSSYSHTSPAVRCLKKSLIAAGFDADFLEFNLKDRRERMLGALMKSEASLFGFSAYIWNIRELLSLAADLERLRPDAHIFFGGPEVSFDTDELLGKNPFIDTIITGEGEEAVVRLASLHARGEALPRVIEGGIYEAFPEQGNIYRSDEKLGGRMIYYESSRGCPFRCAYCLSGAAGPVRAKSAERTLAELSELAAMPGIRVIKFVDRTFNFDRERAKAIWRGLLESDYPHCCHFEICAELLDEESFELLRRFRPGRVQLEIGVQSTDEAVLWRVGRQSDTTKLISAIRRLTSFGNMHIHADLIAGLPGEDFAGFGRSFDALWGSCHMLQLGFLKLLRGSALRSRAGTFGCVYSADPPYTVLKTDCLSFEELERLHRLDGFLDRFGGGAYARGMAILAGRGSPFAVFTSLADALDAQGLRTEALAPAPSYEALYRLSGGGEALGRALLLDFLTHQKGAPPEALDPFLGRTDRDSARDAARAFRDFAADNGIECFPPAFEVRVGTDGGMIICDRRFGRAFRKSKETLEEI